MQTETTNNHYVSPDKLVSICIIKPNHWPSHNYRCAAARVMPAPHERVRELKDKSVEIVFTKEELQALLEAVAICDSHFGFKLTYPMMNKPEARKQFWKKINEQRANRSKTHRGYLSNRRR